MEKRKREAATERFGEAKALGRRRGRCFGLPHTGGAKNYLLVVEKPSKIRKLPKK
jgi:hypothetical protein